MRQVWPPPTVMFVPLNRTGWDQRAGAGKKTDCKVRLPIGAFRVEGVFTPLEQPCAEPEVYYRAFTAVYHQGATVNSGHYWTVVRGSDGYAVADDGTVLRGDAVPKEQRITSATAARRLVLVGLERVDTIGARRTESERGNELAP